jgi:hypothetical protein
MRLKPFSKKEIISYKSGDEDKFIEEIIIPLFEDISDIVGYRNNGNVKVENWGKDRNRDEGIDVYWGYVDHLGREQHYGMQVKTSPIIKRADQNIKNSIITIENQFREAFNKEFENPLSFKNKMKINGFYIITSQKVNKPAREHFLNVMQYFRNIELFDCDDLAGLISRITVQK